MDEQKRITKVVRTVYSTEELKELQRAFEQTGGRIVRTTSLGIGAGISVEIELNGRNKQF